MIPQFPLLRPASRLKCIPRQAKRALRGLAAARDGNAMATIALSIVPLVGFAGLALDGAQWVMWKRELRSAADLSAIAGARALMASQQVNRAVNSALSNNDDRPYTVAAIETPPTRGSMLNDANSVRVVLTYQKTLPFSGLFLQTAPMIAVEATAQAITEVPNCVIALDGSGITAMDVSGSAQLTMNCGMASNSNGDLSGQLVNVPAASAAGTITGGSGLVSTAKITNGIAPTADPQAGLPTPDVAALCAGASAAIVKSMQSGTLNPGCYTDIRSQGSMTLNPGVYYIDGGDVTVNSQSLLQGEGVTLIFTNSSIPFNPYAVGRFNAAGSAYVILSAPTSGTYAGVLMYQDRRASQSNSTNFIVTGNSGGGFVSKIQGTIYAPASKVTFTGNSGIVTNCMQVVSKTVTFTGNTNVSNTCPVGSGAKAYGGGNTVRLKA